MSGARAAIDPRELFSGTWRGDGELVPHLLARLVLRREAVRVTGSGEWLSESVWRGRERVEMASGWAFERRMFMELVAPDRVRATADDIPLGADVVLTRDGFRFERFRSWLAYGGVRFRLGCASSAARKIGRPDGDFAVDFAGGRRYKRTACKSWSLLLFVPPSRGSLPGPPPHEKRPDRSP